MSDHAIDDGCIVRGGSLVIAPNPSSVDREKVEADTWEINNGEGIIIEKGEETNVIADLLTATPLPQADDDQGNGNDGDDQNNMITGSFLYFHIYPADK